MANQKKPAFKQGGRGFNCPCKSYYFGIAIERAENCHCPTKCLMLMDGFFYIGTSNQTQRADSNDKPLQVSGQLFQISLEGAFQFLVQQAVFDVRHQKAQFGAAVVTLALKLESQHLLIVHQVGDGIG
jgi:hypothetical protein